MVRCSSVSSRQHSSSDLLRAVGFFVGVDVHKRSFHVACWNEDHGLIASWVQPASPELLIEKLAPFRGNVQLVVYEAGPTGFGLYRELKQADVPAQVTAPSKLLVASGPEAKSDRLDSKRLAMFAAKRLLTFVSVPTPEQEADRQLLRLREQMVRKSRCIQQQIKSFLLLYSIPEPVGLTNWTTAAVEALRQIDLSSGLRFCLNMLLDEYQHIKEQLAQLKKEIRKLANTERHRETVRLLQTVPGVGPTTSIVFRMELVDPGRFRDGRQISRMLGLAPGVRASGETRREGNILRSGNKRLRSVLVEAAWRWVADDTHAATLYHRLVGNTGNAKKAIVAMARRLGILLWRISVSQQAYRYQPE